MITSTTASQKQESLDVIHQFTMPKIQENDTDGACLTAASLAELSPIILLSKAKRISRVTVIFNCSADLPWNGDWILSSDDLNFIDIFTTSTTGVRLLKSMLSNSDEKSVIVAAAQTTPTTFYFECRLVCSGKLSNIRHRSNAGEGLHTTHHFNNSDFKKTSTTQYKSIYISTSRSFVRRLPHDITNLEQLPWHVSSKSTLSRRACAAMSNTRTTEHFLLKCLQQRQGVILTFASSADDGCLNNATPIHGVGAIEIWLHRHQNIVLQTRIRSGELDTDFWVMTPEMTYADVLLLMLCGDVGALNNNAKRQLYENASKFVFLVFGALASNKKLTPEYYKYMSNSDKCEVCMRSFWDRCMANACLKTVTPMDQQKPKAAMHAIMESGNDMLKLLLSLNLQSSQSHNNRLFVCLCRTAIERLALRLQHDALYFDQCLNDLASQLRSGADATTNILGLSCVLLKEVKCSNCHTVHHTSELMTGSIGITTENFADCSACRDSNFGNRSSDTTATLLNKLNTAEDTIQKLEKELSLLYGESKPNSKATIKKPPTRLRKVNMVNETTQTNRPHLQITTTQSMATQTIATQSIVTQSMATKSMATQSMATQTMATAMQTRAMQTTAMQTGKSQYEQRFATRTNMPTPLDTTPQSCDFNANVVILTREIRRLDRQLEKSRTRRFHCCARSTTDREIGKEHDLCHFQSINPDAAPCVLHDSSWC